MSLSVPSSSIAICAEGIGKQYRIGASRNAMPTLRETIMDSFAAPVRRARRLLRGQAYGAAELSETIWALRDVSFEVKHGEIVGIIGRNGAGKSTLLKVLTRITEPNEGAAAIRGRVGALLEVGAGFHPELTGRENVFLNGAILGMHKAEILKKFDEIVAFSEVEQFLDTPVKHYSSGMFVRLAFAIAAHLQPDVLIVDEVLAVGDAAFQRKCLGKMDSVAHEGRTVLFVSHNLAAIGQLCTRCFLLRKGQLVHDGPVDDVVQRYIAEATPSEADIRTELPEKARVGFRRVWLADAAGRMASEIDVQSAFSIHLDVEVRETVRNVDIGLHLANVRETPITFTNLSHAHAGRLLHLSPGNYHMRVEIPGRFLVPDRYKVSVVSYIPGVRQEVSQAEHMLDQAISFTILETGSKLAAHRDAWRMGCVMNEFRWEHEMM